MKKNTWKFTVISVLLFILGFSILFSRELYLWQKSVESVYNPIPVNQLPPSATKFQLSWAEDVRYLIQTDQLPKEWDSLSKINYYFESEEMEKWQPHLKAPVPLSKNGGFQIDILVVPWSIGDVKAVLIQYDIFENRSKNLIWEISRNIYLKGSEADLIQ